MTQDSGSGEGGRGGGGSGAGGERSGRARGRGASLAEIPWLASAQPYPTAEASKEWLTGGTGRESAHTHALEGLMTVGTSGEVSHF